MPDKFSPLRHFAKKVANQLGYHPRARAAAEELARTEELLAPLEPRFRDPLFSMYRTEPQLGADGAQHPLDYGTRISATQGMWIHHLCVAEKPKATLEIGMAFGFSTLYFLAALAKTGAGAHLALDPFQSTVWKGIGLVHAQAQASALAPGASFEFREERSDRAATDLAREGRSFEIIFIDGNHRFDDVLVDFYLYAPLCAIGGYIILDDMHMSSIKTVDAFLRANRTDFRHVPTLERNISVFQKVSEDSRRHDHFRKFDVSSSAH